MVGRDHAVRVLIGRDPLGMNDARRGLEFVAPIPSPTELADYYNRGYEVPLERYAAAGHRNIARIADLERLCPSRGRLLEFGASYGHSLASARERGWDVAGVELSPTASEYARTHFGMPVFNCDLADAPLADGSFDAVIGWHVLEHVRNPKEQLQRLSRLLKPGGAAHFVTEELETAEFLAGEASQRGLRAVITRTTAGAGQVDLKKT